MKIILNYFFAFLFIFKNLNAVEFDANHRTEQSCMEVDANHRSENSPSITHSVDLKLTESMEEIRAICRGRKAYNQDLLNTLNDENLSKTERVEYYMDALGLSFNQTDSESIEGFLAQSKDATQTDLAKYHFILKTISKIEKMEDLQEKSKEIGSLYALIMCLCKIGERDLEQNLFKMGSYNTVSDDFFETSFLTDIAFYLKRLTIDPEFLKLHELLSFIDSIHVSLSLSNSTIFKNTEIIAVTIHEKGGKLFSLSKSNKLTLETQKEIKYSLYNGMKVSNKHKSHVLEFSDLVNNSEYKLNFSDIDETFSFIKNQALSIHTFLKQMIENYKKLSEVKKDYENYDEILENAQQEEARIKQEEEKAKEEARYNSLPRSEKRREDQAKRKEEERKKTKQRLKEQKDARAAKKTQKKAKDDDNEIERKKEEKRAKIADEVKERKIRQEQKEREQEQKEREGEKREQYFKEILRMRKEASEAARKRLEQTENVSRKESKIKTRPKQPITYNILDTQQNEKDEFDNYYGETEWIIDLLDNVKTLPFDDVRGILEKTLGTVCTKSSSKNKYEFSFISPVNNRLVKFYADAPHGAQLEKKWPAWRKLMLKAFDEAEMLYLAQENAGE